MKNMIKRIIVGVVIGIILMTFKSCKVNAATKYLYNFDSKVATMSFDLCQKDSDNVLCIDGFNKNVNLTNNYQLIYSNTNQLISLKTLSISLISNNSDLQILRYGNITTPIYNLFNNNQNTGYDNNKLKINEFLSYVKITTQDNIECEIVDNVGASLSTSYSPYAVLPYFEVPTECRNKYLKQIDLMFQSGFNYTGNINIFSPIDFTSGMTITNFINNNKNNTYLLSWGIDEKSLNHNIAIASNLGNLQLYFGSSPYTNNTSLNTFNLEQAQIQENLSALNKELFIASSWIGSDTPDNKQFEDISSSINTLSNGLNGSLSTFGFQDFLSALIQKPITELSFMIRNDNIGGNNNLTIKCPTIYLPFKVDHTTGNNIYGMYLPCMSDLYSSIPYVGNSGDSLGSGSLISIYQTVLTGFLTYLLVLSWLNIIKHTITNSPSEIEVYEL